MEPQVTPQISIVTTCKGRLEFLKQTLPRMVAQTDAEVIVVDYDCPEGVGAWVQAHFPEVRVVAVQNAPHFVGARARNLGAAQARAPWLCFTDADILLDPEFSRRLLPELKEGCFYQAQPMPRQMFGTIVLRREDFARADGYDEVIAGWGGEDVDLYGRLMLHGVRRVGFPVGWLGEIPHSDELRTMNREIPNIQISHRVNTLYRHAKLDIMRLLSRTMELEERKALYQEIRTTVEKTPPDGTARIEVTLPTQEMLRLIGGPREMERKLVLSLKPVKRAS